MWTIILFIYETNPSTNHSVWYNIKFIAFLVSLVYKFASVYLDTVVLLHSVFWMCEIGFCSLLRVYVSRRAEQFLLHLL